MKASLDTNVIIHLYRADKQQVLFDFFDEEIYVDEFIYNVELERKGKAVKGKLQQDINSGRIQIITKEWLEKHGVLGLYNEYKEEQSVLYSFSDQGEICAIALAKTLGAMSVVTDDIKMYGPHFTLMRLPESDIMPFACYELIILLYLCEKYSADEAIDILTIVGTAGEDFKFDITQKIKSFIVRSLRDPFSSREKIWFDNFAKTHNLNIVKKLKTLKDTIKSRELVAI